MIRNNHFASLLGIIALGALFFKLPGVPDLFGITECKSCTTSTPYLPMLAAAYFAFIIAIMLSFPSFPSLSVAIGGLFWSIGLMATLTYFSTEWCLICLIAHACHISVWMILLWSSKLKTPQKETLLGMKLSLVFTAPISVMALFSTLNFSFLIYGPHMNPSSDKLVQVGETVKTFQLNTEDQNLLSNSEGVVLNFVSSDCPFCKEQVLKLNEISEEYSKKGFRFVNVSTEIIPELKEYGPNLEWAEDCNEEVFHLFGVAGYPTTILLDSKRMVIDTTKGATPTFEKKLKNKLDQLQLYRS